MTSICLSRVLIALVWLYMFAVLPGYADDSTSTTKITRSTIITTSDDYDYASAVHFCKHICYNHDEYG